MIKSPSLIAVLLFCAVTLHSQIPRLSPNKINQNGKREGPWIVWLNKSSRQIQNIDSVAYYRQISYRDGKPDAIVKEYYSSGKIKWEGNLVSDEPIDVRNGRCISYDEEGNKTEEAQYNRIGKKISFTEYKSKSSQLSDTIVTLLNQGNFSYYQGRYAQALRYWQEGLILTEKKFGKDDENYAKFLNALAVLYQTTGNYDKGEALNLQALKIMKDKMGENSPAYAISATNLGMIYWLAGKYDLAEPKFLLAIKIFRENKLTNHPNYPTLLNNLGAFYLSMGNYEKAKLFLLEATQSIYGQGVQGYTTYLNNLAEVYLAEKNFAEAENLIVKAARIDKQFTGDSSLRYATSLMSLGKYYFDVGKLFKAKLTYNECLSIYGKNLGDNHPYFATAENNLGSVCKSMGDLKQSERYYLDGGRIIKNTLGDHGDRYADFLSQLATLYRNMDKLEKAESFYLQLNENLLTQIDRFFPTLSEKEKEEFYKVMKDRFEEFYSFGILRYPSNPRMSELIFNMQLATKALLLNSSAKWKQHIRSSGDKKLASLYYSWEDKNAILAKLFKETDSAKRRGIDSLQTEINQLEKELSQRSESFSQLSDRKRYTWQDVQQKLLPNEAAIEIIRLRKYGVKKMVTDSSDASFPRYPKRGLTDTVYYVALLVTPASKQPDLVVLKNGNDLEKKGLHYYRNSISTQKLDELSYEAFWKPISKALGKKIKKIYFSPDGVYNSINLNTLYNSSTKKYLLEEIDLQLLTTSKDLVAVKKEEDFNTLAYLFGYPNYQVSKEARATLLKKERSAQPTYYSLAIERGNNLEELPATKTEVENVATMLKEKGWHPELFIEDQALEENIKDIFKPRVLHIATHGYFQPDSLLSAHTNPLLQSGLMLTGAGRTLSGDKDDKTEDGILTAYEAMNLNLDNTDLVVLSACETGLGEIRNGEGVYGLQRAFKVAGAKSIIMSLWKVNDDATQELISEFYKIWLNNGNDKRNAFKQAQVNLKQKYPSPYFWGAFVMVGI